MKAEVKFQLFQFVSLLTDIAMYEEFFDVISGEKRTSEYSCNFVNISIEFKVMFNDGDKAICANGDINLYSDGIFGVTPKGFDAKMLLYPFKEQLNSPSIFVKKSDVFCLEIKVVRIVNERSFEFGSIVNDSSDFRRIIVPVTFAGKSNGLIKKNIVVILKHFFSGDNLKLRMSFLPYDKKGIEFFNMIKPCQIKVSSVKDVTSQRFIRDVVHCIDVVYIGSGNCKRSWNLGNNVNLSMNVLARRVQSQPKVELCRAAAKRLTLLNLYAGLGASEFCPFKECHAKIYRSRIEGIKSPVKFKFTVNAFVLSYANHVIGKLFKDVIISKLICLGQDAPVYRLIAKAKMVRFIVCAMVISVSSRRLLQPSS